MSLQDYVNNSFYKLVPDQHESYDLIIQNFHSDRNQIFYLDAPGVTGKPFLINLLLAYVRSTSSLAIGVVSSGIAATLLNGERTADSIFKLSLNVSCEQESICSFRKNSSLAAI